MLYLLKYFYKYWVNDYYLTWNELNSFTPLFDNIYYKHFFFNYRANVTFLKLNDLFTLSFSK